MPRNGMPDRRACDVGVDGARVSYRPGTTGSRSTNGCHFDAVPCDERGATNGRAGHLGIVNVLRALGTLAGDAMLDRILTVRERMHANVILDSAVNVGAISAHAAGSTFGQLPEIAERISEQAFVLSIADGYLVLGALAVVLIPLVLNLQYIKPPVLNTTSK